jgi:hypothetical protein
MRSLAVKMREMVGWSRGDDNVRVSRVRIFLFSKIYIQPIDIVWLLELQAHRSP